MAEEGGTVRQIGRYEVIRKIATGGMAELFLARFVGPGGFEKRCALKRILPQFATDQVFTRMFLNEARVTAMFDHPNLVQIFELGQDDRGQFFIAMELVNGINLRQLLHLARERQVAIPPELAAFMMMQALDGLAYAHGFRDPDGRPLNLVHRDISPQNILVSYEGAVKLVDFGIVKGSSISGETQAGMLKGKVTYMSPEQASGERMDGRSDLFSLGVCFYELIAQERPFVAVNELMTLKAILEKPPVALTRYVPDVPEPIERAIYRALEKNPEDRYTSAREFHLELTAILRACPTPIGRHVVGEFLQSLTEGSTVTFDPTRLRIPRRPAGFGHSATAADLAPVPPAPRPMPVDRAPTIRPDPTPTPTGSHVAPLTSISTDLRAAGLDRRVTPVMFLVFLISAITGAVVVWAAMRDRMPVVVENLPVQAPPPIPEKTPTKVIAANTNAPPVEVPEVATGVDAGAAPHDGGADEVEPVEDDAPETTRSTKKKKRKKRRRRSNGTSASNEAADDDDAPPPPPPPPPTEPGDAPRTTVTRVEPPATPTGTLRLTSSPAGLFVTEGTEKLGTTPVRLDLPAGKHRIVLSSRRLGIRRVLELSINANTTTTEIVTVPKGSLKVISRPWAWVHLDGTKVGRTPITVEAYEGKHELKLIAETGEEQTRMVQTQGSEEQLVTVKF